MALLVVWMPNSCSMSASVALVSEPSGGKRKLLEQHPSLSN
jgi:hypothetical protein